MNNSICHLLNSPSIDWVAILALTVAIISVCIAIRYNQRILQLTEKHY